MNTRLVMACVTSFLLAACAASQTGQQPMDRAQVESIQKGGTTREQVDAMLGPPRTVVILDNGDRLASYRTHQTTTPPVNPVGFIPLFGPFIEAATEENTSVRRQTLQVRFTASGVVRDYEFLDTTTTYGRDGTVTRGNTGPIPARQPT